MFALFKTDQVNNFPRLTLFYLGYIRTCIECFFLSYFLQYEIGDKIYASDEPNRFIDIKIILEFFNIPHSIARFFLYIVFMSHSCHIIYSKVRLNFKCSKLFSKLQLNLSGFYGDWKISTNNRILRENRKLLNCRWILFDIYP